VHIKSLHVIIIIIILKVASNVNVNVNKQYLFTRKSCNKGYDGCAMRVVFSKLQNCPGFIDGDFRDGGSAFQHMGPTYSN